MTDQLIRIAIPALTEERRKDLVKIVKKQLKKPKLRFEIFVVMQMMN